MSDAFNASDLLSGLAANPELLKNAMQMASALASSGALNGLFGGGGNSAPPSAEPSAATASAPIGGSGGFADLLSGLMGAGGGSKASAESPSAGEKKDSAPVSAHPSGGQGKHSAPAPCHQDRVRLLQSICPFLPEDKRDKVQFLIKLLELLSTAEGMGLGRLF
ncbi:MAG: hypothetical protein IJX76_07290 [Clostridia bacterium]|nr:hypothetical protein [Clostridia bacterium]